MKLIKTNPVEKVDQLKPNAGILIWLSLALIIIGLIILLMFGGSASAKATILLWMLACLLTGAAIGFLFGIPKILQGNQSSSTAGTTGSTATSSSASPVPYQQQVNSNLTEISDWLTKIIVGLGLVNLTKIGPVLSDIAKILAAALDNSADKPNAYALPFAYGTIVAYTILGFLFGYITTRLYLATAFSEADQRALTVIATKTNEAVATAQSAIQKAEFALTSPRADQSNSNAGVGAQALAAPQDDLDKLVREYNEIRSTMSSGYPRTTRMTAVVRKMVDLANALQIFDVGGALKDADGGKRLSAYAYLYSRPDYVHLPDLVDALTSETTPFGQYWAIQSLGKILALRPSDSLETGIYNKLKTYYNSLAEGVDRKFELGRILPGLKTK